MALATQCPHCHTAFRVAHDQLKLRAGLVRCGACKQIFNGIEHLLAPEDQVPLPGAPSSTPSVAPSAVTESAAGARADMSDAPAAASEANDPDKQAIAPAVVPQPIASSMTPPEVDPLQRMTLLDFAYLARRSADDNATPETPPAPQDPTAPDALEQAIDALQRQPLRTERDELEDKGDDEADYEEPSFVKQGRRRQRVGRSLQLAMGIGSLLLLISLLAQGIYVFRNQLAARFPQAKPALVQACSMLGCELGLPAQIEALSLESSELQALAPEKNIFALTTLLRNQGSIAQAWPSIELTLNDANDKPVARRVFTPRDYLASSQDVNKGVAPRSEQSIKLFFELSQVKASGFRVYLFYP
jgi:predicted Zn finger-like uncharacterized protein